MTASTNPWARARVGAEGLRADRDRNVEDGEHLSADAWLVEVRDQRGGNDGIGGFPGANESAGGEEFSVGLPVPEAFRSSRGEGRAFPKPGDPRVAYPSEGASDGEEAP